MAVFCGIIGLGTGKVYGMMIFLIGLWCFALESAWQRFNAKKVQNRLE